MALSPKIPQSVARTLGFYVYLYVNPLDDTVFYVGKGRGGRALAHLNAEEERDVAKIIKEMRSSGVEPQIDILAHGLPNEKTALAIEAAVIDLMGIHNLANAVRGRGAKYGRMPLQELIAHYTHRKARITEPSILIRINKLYHYGMTPIELYDATRSAWKVANKRDKAEYAFAVFEGVVREVYRITSWVSSGSTFNVRYNGKGFPRRGRWEFVGTLAEDSLRQHYINSYVGHLFTQGAQNPITYVNIAD